MKSPFAPGADTEPRLCVDGNTFPLSGTKTSVGRSKDNDVVLEHESVSTTHAEIERQPGRWVLRDLGSTNGTRLNGLAVTEAELQNGDSILFGDCVAKFEAVSHPLKSKKLLIGIALTAILVFAIKLPHGDSPANSGPSASQGISGERSVNIPFTVVDQTYTMAVTKVMFGDSVVTNNVIHEFKLDDARSRKKELVYLEFTLTNKTNSTRYVTYQDFVLEDEEGFSYSPMLTLDSPNHNVPTGKSIRAGVGFEVPQSARLVALLYKTQSYYPSGKPMYAFATLVGIALKPFFPFMI